MAGGTSPAKYAPTTSGITMKRPTTSVESHLPTKRARQIVGDSTQQLLTKWKLAPNHNSTATAIAAVKTPSRASVEDLPPEMLLLVFQWLSTQELCASVAPVCRRWAALVRHPCLWKVLAFRGQYVTTQVVSGLLARATQLQKLSLVERADAAAILRQVSRSNRMLRSLVIKRCRGTEQRAIITADLLLNLIKSCKQLHALTIKDTQFRSAKFYRILGSSLPRLKRINFSYNLQFGSTALNSIASNCEPLEELRAFRDFGFRSSLPHCYDLDIQILSSRMGDTLKVLKLNSAELTDHAVHSIVHCCHLETLHIRFALNVTDAGIISLGQLEKLTSLEISMARNITSMGWCEMFTQAKWNMKRLGLAVCALVDDQVLDCIGTTCQNLEKIRLSGCIRITEEGVSRIIRGCNELKYLNVFFTQLNVVQSFPLIPHFIPQLKTLVFRPFGFDEELLILEELRNNLPNLVIQEEDDCKRDDYWRHLHI